MSRRNHGRRYEASADALSRIAADEGLVWLVFLPLVSSSSFLSEGLDACCLYRNTSPEVLGFWGKVCFCWCGGKMEM